MATHTIKSRILKETFTFWVNGDKGSIYLERGKNVGTLGTQICQGGGFSGSCLSASNEENFIKQCNTWYRNYLKTTTYKGE